MKETLRVRRQIYNQVLQKAREDVVPFEKKCMKKQLLDALLDKISPKESYIILLNEKESSMLNGGFIEDNGKLALCPSSKADLALEMQLRVESVPNRALLSFTTGQINKSCRNCIGRIKRLLDGDLCDMTAKRIENLSSVCKDWEPNQETKEVMQEHELKTLHQECDKLQNQIGTLCEALETALHGLVTTDNLLATDRPDMLGKEEVMWTTNNSKEIEIVKRALAECRKGNLK